MRFPISTNTLFSLKARKELLNESEGRTLENRGKAKKVLSKKLNNNSSDKPRIFIATNCRYMVQYQKMPDRASGWTKESGTIKINKTGDKGNMSRVINKRRL